MKKNLLFVMTIIYCFTLNGQSTQITGPKGNTLTQSEFESVSFGSVTLKQLMEAKADIDIVNSLFSNIISGTNDTAPFLLRYFENSNLGITIKGKTYKVGDPVSVFDSSISINTYNDSYQVFFYDEETGSTSLIFRLSKRNNTITRFEYIAF